MYSLSVFINTMLPSNQVTTSQLVTFLLPFIFTITTMESDTATSVSHSSRQNADQSDPSDPPAVKFSLSNEDIEALRDYLEEFKEANAERRSTIIANAMADIVTLRPDDEPFNKVEASKVIFMSYVRFFNRFICCFRKSENGFIITILDQRDNTSSSSGAGPLATPFIISVEMKS